MRCPEIVDKMIKSYWMSSQIKEWSSRFEFTKKMITRKRKNYKVCNDNNDDDNKVVVAFFILIFQQEQAMMG